MIDKATTTNIRKALPATITAYIQKFVAAYSVIEDIHIHAKITIINGNIIIFLVLNIR